MGIRRLTFTAFDTTQTDLKDSLVHINSDASGENTTDMGFLLNRGTLGNVGIIWDESADTFAFISTTSNALVEGDMAITNYAELVSGNITGDNLITAGVVDATGNITGGNITTAGLVSATGNVIGGNLTTAGLVSATGNVSGGNLTTTGIVDATGNITGGNIITAGTGTFGTMTDGTVSFTSGNISGVDELRIDENGTGLRMTNVGAFDNSSGNFRIFSTSGLVLSTNGDSNPRITIDSTGDVTFADGAFDVDIASHDGTNGLKLGGTLVTASATELNYLDGVTGVTLGTANELLIVGSDGTSIISDSTLSIDTGSNYIGINQSSPEVTLHMTGEGAQTAQIRMEQYNDTSDAPDVRTRRYRGTIASPSAVQSGDYLFRSNHEYWNGTSLLIGGAFAFDNTNNAARTEYRIAVDTDGTGGDILNGWQFKIDGNDGGAITFNNAYKFPTSDGSANQILQTNGSGALSFTGAPTFTGLTVDTNTLYVDAANNRIGIGTTSPAYQVEIENTGNNALLVLDRTDGAATFIEGGASDSVLGSVGANDVKIAYNSIPVVTVGAGGDITTSGNISATEFQGVATSAQYADLAEKYLPDQVYSPGLVLIIGGDAEVTASSEYADPRIAGVVSTDPAFKMNSALENGVYIALRGRVPCFVVGEIAKGDLLTSSHVPGIATRLNPGDFLPGCVIGKALENYNSNDIGTIEVLIGSL